MKIIVFSQFYFPEPFRVSEICEELVRKGNEVTVITTFPNYPNGEIYKDYRGYKKKIEFINGVKIIRCYSIPRGHNVLHLALSYISFAINTVLYLRNLRTFKFDIIYVYQLSPIFMAIPALKLKKKLNIPVFLYCLDIWPESIKDLIKNEKSFIFLIVKKISGFIYKNVDIIGVTSKSFKLYFNRTFNILNDKMCYIPQHAENFGKINKSNKKDTGFIDIFFIGNVGESQNIEIMIDAVDKIRDISNFRLNIVGDGSCLNKAKKIVKYKHLDKYVIFYGRHPLKDMTHFYSLADACLVILTGKTFVGNTIPGKLQGYMSAGIPVIGSVNGDANELINEANCGICVKADDSYALANAFREFINKLPEAENMGNNARKYYENNFTLEKHVNSLLFIFKDLILKEKKEFISN